MGSVANHAPASHAPGRGEGSRQKPLANSGEKLDGQLSWEVASGQADNGQHTSGPQRGRERRQRVLEQFDG